MKNENLHKEILQKRQKLQEVTTDLKKQFIGLYQTNSVFEIFDGFFLLASSLKF